MSWFYLVTTVAVAVAGGIQSYQQGQANKDAANANAALREKSARHQLTIARLNDQVMQRQAEYEQNLAELQAQSSYANAQAARNEAEAIAAQERENAARQRKADQAALARNRGIYAGAGLVDTTGTPLAMLAEQTLIQESALADSNYLANLERGQKLFEADLYQLEGDTKNFEGYANAAISKQASGIRGLTAQVNYNLSMKEAEIERRTGKSNADSATIGAIASTIGGVSSGYDSSQTRKLRRQQVNSTTGG